MGADSQQDLVLAVTLNGQRASVLSHFHEHDGHLAASGSDLSAMGFAIERIGITETAEVQLDSIPGVSYTYDAAHQIVNLQIPDEMRRPYALDSRNQHSTPQATSARGLVINYDAFAQSVDGGQIALFSEQRYFSPLGVFSTTGIADLSRRGQRYTRFDTSWSEADPAAPSTIRIGDTISSALAWTRAIRLGGFQWRSDFALRPDLVTFAVPALAGSAVVPSAIDLYINNVRQFSTNVPSGPFIVNDVPGINGAGLATVITRDALGRTIATSVPLYVDARLMAPGFSGYSFEAGFLRRGYGLESFDYGPVPAVSVSATHGVSEILTVEGHAEATGGLVNAGAGALLRLGMAGVVNGAFSGSSGRLSGTQISLGYQLIEPRFSVSAQTIRAFRHYGDLAARDGAAVSAITDQVTLSLPFLQHQAFSINYVGTKLPQGASSKIGAVSYTSNIGRLASVSMTAFRNFKQHNESGAYLTISFAPRGERLSVNSTFGKQNGQWNRNVNALRPPDYGGGWGWGAQMGGSGAAAYRQAQLQRLGNAGEVTALAQDAGRHLGASLELSGAIVVMDGSLQRSRRIDDAFALVSTAGIAGIPVLHENRVIGRTDASGHLLIPDLNAYQANRLSIDGMKLPADMLITTTQTNVVPQMHSGLLAHFDVMRYSAASVILRDPGGTLLPAGTRVHHVESGIDTIVGYDGVAFIASLQPDNHLLVDSNDQHCVAQFHYERVRDGVLPTLGPLVCRPEAREGQ